eukprot:7357656-Heterocapsa_arctica.AAC.1
MVFIVALPSSLPIPFPGPRTAAPAGPCTDPRPVHGCPRGPPRHYVIIRGPKAETQRHRQRHRDTDRQTFGRTVELRARRLAMGQ